METIKEILQKELEKREYGIKRTNWNIEKIENELKDEQQRVERLLKEAEEIKAALKWS